MTTRGILGKDDQKYVFLLKLPHHSAACNQSLHSLQDSIKAYKLQIFYIGSLAYFSFASQSSMAFSPFCPTCMGQCIITRGVRAIADMITIRQYPFTYQGIRLIMYQIPVFVHNGQPRDSVHSILLFQFVNLSFFVRKRPRQIGTMLLEIALEGVIVLIL